MNAYALQPSASPDGRPSIVHVLDRFDIGGMELIALELIRQTRDRYRHRVLCLRDKGALAPRLEEIDVPVETLGKRPGKDMGAYLRLWRRLREISPAIVHTYNIGAIDVAFWARAAGVRTVIHAEHGRDASDPEGANPKYRWMRRLLAPMITRFVAVSTDLAEWLVHDIGVTERKVLTVKNGVDTARYYPAGQADAKARSGSKVIRIGSCGRLDRVKDFATLIDAFSVLIGDGNAREIELVIIGNGPEREALEERIRILGLDARVTLAGARDDVEEILRSLDIYVCSSIAEGIALTVLEAMASGLPVVATEVGGTPEIVVASETGLLIPSGNPQALADALGRLCDAPKQARAMGVAGRKRVVTEFSQQGMIDGYCALYNDCLSGRFRFSASRGE